MDMLWVNPGTFEMGSPPEEEDRRDRETQHTVTLTEGYWLGKHPVTQAQWQKVTRDNPSHFKGANRPVEKVSWTEVTSFCDKLTEMEKKAGRVPKGMAYQLPTEAQWEYACRAGTKTAFSFGDSLTFGQANIRGGPGETVDVGKYPANEWGFQDMHGNAWEWCQDWYGDYPRGAVRDPVGLATGASRVARGGSWSSTASSAVPRTGTGTCPPAATMSWASASVSDQQAKGGGRDGKLSQNLQRRRTSRRITLVRIEPDNIFVKPLVYGIDNDTRPLHSDSFGIVALLLVGINSRIIPGPLIQVQPILLVVRPHEWIDCRRGPLPPALRMPPKPYAVGWVSSHESQPMSL